MILKNNNYVSNWNRLGHGETQHLFMTLIEKKLDRLHILDGNTAESCKVESAVCRNAETGEWQFAKGYS